MNNIQPVNNAAVMPAADTEDYMNCIEDWALYDTILVNQNISDKPGWFASFAALAAANLNYFFNVRSRAIGLPYCNLDKRDSMAFPMLVESMGVTFFAPQVESTEDSTYQEDIVNHIWETDLPRHASIVFSVMQDERVKNTVMLTPPGYGPIGGGVGQGDPETSSLTKGMSGLRGIVKSATSQGVPDIDNRYKFPIPLEVPRNGRIQATLKFSAYGRGLLEAMPGPWSAHFGGGAVTTTATDLFYGIQVSLMGKRGVQQRGQYHA